MKNWIIGLLVLVLIGLSVCNSIKQKRITKLELEKEGLVPDTVWKESKPIVKKDTITLIRHGKPDTLIKDSITYITRIDTVWREHPLISLKMPFKDRQKSFILTGACLYPQDSVWLSYEWIQKPFLKRFHFGVEAAIGSYPYISGDINHGKWGLGGSYFFEEKWAIKVRRNF